MAKRQPARVQQLVRVRFVYFLGLPTRSIRLKSDGHDLGKQSLIATSLLMPLRWRDFLSQSGGGVERIGVQYMR